MMGILDFFTKPSKLEARLKDIELSMAALHDNLRDEVAEKERIIKEKELLAQELNTFKQQEEEKRSRYESKEPWIEILSSGEDSDKGMRMDLDWNKAFIDYLAENGISAPTEEEAVQLYLSLLYRDMAYRIEEENNAKKSGKMNGFE